jgi:AcrR family transcriptional regulator
LTDSSAATSARRPVEGRQTQAERRRLSEGRIINAALEVIAERGVSRMTLAEVGERAGYSRGLPAHLFGTKSNLLCECMRRMDADHWMNRLPEVGPAAGLKDLEAAVKRWFHELETRVAFTRAYYALIQEANCEGVNDHWPELCAVVREVVTGGQARYADYIRAAQARGEARAGLDPDMEAAILHTTMRGVGLQWLIRPDSVDLKRFEAGVLGKIEAFRVK